MVVVSPLRSVTRDLDLLDQVSAIVTDLPGEASDQDAEVRITMKCCQVYLAVLLQNGC